MARITWISAVQEYNARNKTKVKGKKGSPEYPAIKKIFEELKAGTTKRTEPAKKKEAKKVKLSGGESIEIECEGGEIKVRETKQPPPPKTQEKKEQEQKKYEEEKKVFDEDLDKKIIPILEEQSQLQKKYERLAYQERLLEYEGRGDAKRYEEMTKLFDKIKKLGDKLKPILKEAGISKSPYSMFKEDYKTYKKFDVDTLDMSERKANRIIEKKEAAERKRQQEKEEEEEENYGVLDIEAKFLEDDRERMKNMSVEEKMEFMKDKEKAISDRSRGIGRPQETQEEKDERRRKLGVPLESEKPKKEQPKKTAKQIIEKLYIRGDVQDIKRLYQKGEITEQDLKVFIKDVKNDPQRKMFQTRETEKTSYLQSIINECPDKVKETMRFCLMKLKDNVKQRNIDKVNEEIKKFRDDFLSDKNTFMVHCWTLKYLKEKKCDDEIKKVLEVMKWIKNNGMKKGKATIKKVKLEYIQDVINAIEGGEKPAEKKTEAPAEKKTEAPAVKKSLSDVDNNKWLRMRIHLRKLCKRENLTEEEVRKCMEKFDYIIDECYNEVKDMEWHKRDAALKKCMEEKMPLLKQVVISKTQPKKEETKKEEPKKRDLKSKLERLRKRLCPSDDIDKKDIHFDDTKNEAEINKKLRKLAARLHPDKNPDCEEEAEEKFKYLQEQKERKIREFAEESGEEVSEFSKLSKLYADFYAKYEEFKKNEKDEKIRKELLKMFKKVKKVYNEEYEGIGIQENFLLGVVLERMVTLAEKVRKDLMRTHKKTKK